MKTKWLYSTVALLFVVLLTAAGVLIFALPDRTFSENENRILSGLPEFSLRDVAEGEWQAGLASYSEDQFPLRDVWTEWTVRLRCLFGAKDIDGTYLGKNGRRFEVLRVSDMPDETAFSYRLSYLELFAEKYPDTAVVLLPAPDAGSIYAEDLPDFADYYDVSVYDTLLAGVKDSVTVCDVTDALLAGKSLGNLYYLSDHHWTTRGAYLAYCAYCEAVGLAAQPLDAFRLVSVTDAFRGTLFSKAPDSSLPADTVEVPTLADTVTAVADGKVISVIDRARSEEKDAYLVFFGGNHATVEIRNSAVTNGKTLLVFKDSYANCFVPFLTGEYETIVMVDLRYFGGSVESLMSQYVPTQTLFLYQFSSFAGDTNLTKLLR